MAFFALDIDQTISSGYIGTSVQASAAYYRERGISIPQDATRYSDFFQIPEVLSIHECLPGALQGVKYLSERGTVAYFTVRKHDVPSVRTQIEQVTHEWLRGRGFPASEHVTFCQSMAHKLLALCESQQGTQEQLILIDDRWNQAVNALHVLEEYGAETKRSAEILRARLTIVAFGAPKRNLPVQSIVRLIALPDWSHLQQAKLV